MKINYELIFLTLRLNRLYCAIDGSWRNSTQARTATQVMSVFAKLYLKKRKVLRYAVICADY